MADKKTKKGKLRIFRFPWFKKVENIIQNSNVLEEFETNFETFVKLSKEVDSKWATIQNWRLIISNAGTGEDKPSLVQKGQKRGMMEANNKKWIALSLAFDLFRILLADMSRFVAERVAFVGRIRKLDTKLADQISSLKLPQREVIEVLGPLMSILNNPQLLIPYIKTHYEDIMQKIDMMKDKDLAEKLRKIIIVLSNREVEELVKCTNDVRSWPYRLAYSRPYRVEDFIDVLIERATLFIIGGRSKYDGESFLGFRTHFKDEKLVQQMYATPEIKQLLTYKQEVEFFRRARNAIQISVKTESRWEGFENFYNNLRKGRNYIGMVRDRFGNERFAKLLEAFEAKKHEAGIDWGLQMGELGNDLIKKADELVIQPAVQALTRIFEAKIKELQLASATALADLKKLLKEQDSRLKIRREFLKLLAKRRKGLLGELDKERLKFSHLIRDIVRAMPEYELKLSKVEALIKAIDPALIAELHISDSSLKARRFTLSNIPTIPDDETLIENDDTTRALTRGEYGITQALKVAHTEAKISALVMHQYTLALQLLKVLISICNIIQPREDECVSHIDSKKEEYLDEINRILQSKLYLTMYQTREGTFSATNKVPVNEESEQKETA